jgi:hypothetical protein
MAEMDVRLHGGELNGAVHTVSSRVETWGLVQIPAREPHTWALHQASNSTDHLGNPIWAFVREIDIFELRANEN